MFSSYISITFINNKLLFELTLTLPQLKMNYIFDHIIEKFNLNHNKFPTKGNGEFIIYHRNGEIRIKTFMKNGKRSGPAEWYHENGKLKIRANYNDGELEGTYEEYDENGLLEFKTIYNDARLNSV